MTDAEKEQYINGVEKKYKKRFGARFKNLFGKAQRETYRDDVLQPFESRFKQRWYQAWKDRKLMHDAAEREVIRREKEKEELYRRKPSRNVVTVEEKILKDIQLEHPKMIEDEDILKHRVN